MSATATDGTGVPVYDLNAEGIESTNPFPEGDPAAAPDAVQNLVQMMRVMMDQYSEKIQAMERRLEEKTKETI